MDSPKYTPADKDLTANVADPVLSQTEATIEGVIVALRKSRCWSKGRRHDLRHSRPLISASDHGCQLY